MRQRYDNKSGTWVIDDNQLPQDVLEIMPPISHRLPNLMRVPIHVYSDMYELHVDKHTTRRFTLETLPGHVRQAFALIKSVPHPNEKAAKLSVVFPLDVYINKHHVDLEDVGWYAGLTKSTSGSPAHWCVQTYVIIMTPQQLGEMIGPNPRS